MREYEDSGGTGPEYWLKYKDGKLIQRRYLTTDSGGSTNWNFPIGFNTVLTGHCDSNATNSNADFIVDSLTTTSCRVNQREGSGVAERVSVYVEGTWK